MRFKLQKYNLAYFAIAVIAILHGVGSFGLLSKFSNQFATLTTLNLFICFLLLLAFNTDKFQNVFKYLIIAFSFGMLVEIIGVKTGIPFGAYYYTDILSPLVLGVPLIIGINWFILSYGLISLLNNQLKSINYYLKSALAALLMTSIDVLIEPFAIRYELWVWANQNVPLANYLAWYAISFSLFLIGFKLLKNETNLVAIFTVIIFIIFFTINNLMNSLLG